MHCRLKIILSGRASVVSSNAICYIYVYIVKCFNDDCTCAVQRVYRELIKHYRICVIFLIKHYYFFFSVFNSSECVTTIAHVTHIIYKFLIITKHMIYYIFVFRGGQKIGIGCIYSSSKGGFVSFEMAPLVARTSKGVTFRRNKNAVYVMRKYLKH